ncbi:MAG: hypothetical protein H6547_02700 [Chitinophagales bacterium]|nr:hypothetical protein [Chitinophagales bacterium]
MKVYKDLTDFISNLNQCGVRYLLVGGYAVQLHGYPRFTQDMDIWVDRTSENYRKLVTAFGQFGLPLFDMTEEVFLTHPDFDVFTFGRPPVSIDIMVLVKGLNFSDAYADKKTMEFDEVQVDVLSLEKLLVAKKASGRFKDLDDIEHLKAGLS